jgi:hypothetical protein
MSDMVPEASEVEFPPEIMYPATLEEMGETSSSVPACKLTVVERVYHRQGNHPPLQIESKFEHVLAVDEACYFRPGCKVTEDWQALDFGWLKDNAGTIVIQNITGRFLSKIPTPDKKRELDAKLLEVGVVAPIPIPFALVPPKQNVRLNLMPGLTYLVRCQSGPAEFNLYAIPR